MQRTNMPKSCVTVYQLLERTGSQTHKDIVSSTGLAHALSDTLGR